MSKEAKKETAKEISEEEILKGKEAAEMEAAKLEEAAESSTIVPSSSKGTDILEAAENLGESLQIMIDTLDDYDEVQISLTHETDLKIEKGKSKNFIFCGLTDVTMQRQEGEGEEVKTGVPILMDSDRKTYLGLNKLLIDAFNQPLAMIWNPYKITFVDEVPLGGGKKYKKFDVAKLATK